MKIDDMSLVEWLNLSSVIEAVLNLIILEGNFCCD